MKKLLLFLFALLTTATVWAQEFTPLQMGDNGPFNITNDGVYLSFTPQETDYYVFVGTSEVKLDFAINLWSPDFVSALSELDEATNTYVSHLAWTQKLEAGVTYKLRLDAYLQGESGEANVVVSKGYLVSTDAESAGLMNMLRPLPYVAFEGKDVKLTANAGVTINSLTATANGEPVEITVSGSVYSFTMPAADVTISGSGEMPTLQLGDNEVNVFDMISYAFTPTESGAYIFTMDCDVDAVVQISSGNEMIQMGSAPPLETLSDGVMLDANVTYGVMAFANVDGSNIDALTLNISKYELAPITVGDNEIYAPNGEGFYYPFIPEESGEYTFSTSGFAPLNPAAAVMLGEDVIGYYNPTQTDVNMTVTLQAGVVYAFRAYLAANHGAFIHLNVSKDGGSSGGDDNIVLQMGENGPFTITNDGVYLSFTPQETDYYVFSTVVPVPHSLGFKDELFRMESEPAPFGGLHGLNLGLGQKLNAGQTYFLKIQKSDYGTSGQTYVMVSKGYLVSIDAESQLLDGVLFPLPMAAYEGQEVKLINGNGFVINDLTATANGYPIEVTRDETGMVYTFTMPAADVVISGSCDMPSLLQLGDNEVALVDEPTVYFFTPTESGAYIFTLNSDDEAMFLVALDEEGETISMGMPQEPGQTPCAAAMLEAGVTYSVITRLPQGDSSGILNVAKYDIAPITVGENEIYAPFGVDFKYPFTPPVSGEYTFRTTGDASLLPTVGVLLGEDILSYEESQGEDLEFTATLEAGVTYSVATFVSSYNASLIHLTVVSPQHPSFAITLAEALASGSNGDNVTLSDALAVVQKTEDGAFAYVTDGNDHWARLEGDAVADLVVGSGITSISGELTQMGIAPTIVLAGAPTEADAPDYQIMRLDLQHDIAAPPAPCQVVSVSGYYDGLKVRAFHSEPQGQGLLINADHTTLALQVGHLYDIVGAIELFEPWDDDASGAPRRVKTTDDDFLDNIYLMLIGGDEEIVTSITDLNAAKRSGQRYNVLGQPVGSDHRGIVIENGKKRVIK